MSRHAHDTRAPWLGLPAIAATALVYLVSGWLGLSLAVPPGYATPIWIPSGLALAAALLIGPSAAVGAVIGSFCVNLLIASRGGDINLSALMVASLIALGAGAQALIGAVLVRRRSWWRGRLERGGEIFGLLALGGPVACLINATWSVGWLHALGVIPTEALGINWITWWAGDTIGVLVVTPPALSWFAQGEAGRRRVWFSALGVLIGFSLVILAVSAMTVSNHRRVTERFEGIVPLMVGSLRDALHHQVTAVMALEGLFSRGDVTPEMFELFAMRLRRSVPNLDLLEWAPVVQSQDAAAFEARMTATLGRPFKIHGIGDRDGPPSDGVHQPVTYLSPLKGNEAASGLDLLSSADRARTLREASDRGMVEASSAIDLVQGGLGVLLIKAVRDDVIGDVRGHVVSVIRLRSLVSRVLETGEWGDIAFWVEELGPNRRVIATNAAKAPGSMELVERGLFGRRLSLGASMVLRVGGHRKWLLTLAPTPAFLARQQPEYRLAILMAGMTLTGLLGAVVLLVVGREATLAAQVAARTDDLSRQRVILARQVENMRQINVIAASREATIDELLDKALRLAAAHLRMPVGYVTRLTDGVLHIEHAVGVASGATGAVGTACPIEDTYCELAANAQDVVAIERISDSPWATRRRDAMNRMEAYIGSPIVVGGAIRGTICFLDPAPYARAFDEGDLEFIRLLAGWVGAMMERRDLSDDLARTARRLEAILTAAPIGVAIIDGERRLRMVNHGMTELFDLPASAFLGRSTRMLYPDDETYDHIAEQLYPTIRVGDVAEAELPMCRGDGRRFWARAIGRLLSLDRPEEGIVLVILDITARREAEEALRTRSRALERSNAELEAFANLASHDLRQPLRQIANYLTLLERGVGGNLSDENAEFLRVARDGARHMDRIIVDLLEYCEVGRARRPFVAVPLGPVVANVIGSGETDGIRFAEITRVEGEAPTAIGDAGEIGRALTHLIKNAIRFRHPDRAPQVVIRFKTEGATCAVEVADNGIGIDESHLNRIFGVFQRLGVDQSAARGTGMGLAVCGKIAHQHGGAIKVASRLGEGSLFTLELPTWMG